MNRATVMRELRIPERVKVGQVRFESDGWNLVVYADLPSYSWMPTYGTFFVSMAVRKAIELSNLEPQEFFELALIGGVDPNLMTEHSLDIDLMRALEDGF